MRFFFEPVELHRNTTPSVNGPHQRGHTEHLTTANKNPGFEMLGELTHSQHLLPRARERHAGFWVFLYASKSRARRIQPGAGSEATFLLTVGCFLDIIRGM